jgi:fucose permease
MGTQTIAMRAAPRRGYLFALLSAGFVLTGLEITLLAPLLPVFMARWSMNDARAGIFFPVQFGLSLGGVWLSSLLTHLFGNRTPIILGYLMMAAGLATVNSSSLPLTVLALGALCLGYGLVVPGTNLTAAEIGGSRSASYASIVNFAWAAGAVSCSWFVRMAPAAKLLSQMLYVCAGFGCLLAMAFLLAEFPSASQHASSSLEEASASPGNLVTVVLVSLFFLYVGTEASLGGWSAAHASRLSNSGTDLSTIAPMFFYGGLMTGRVLAPFILARIREYALVLTELLLIVAGTAVFIYAPSQRTAFLGVAFAGLGCSAIFPICVAWLSRWYGPTAVRIRGVMFSMSSVGSAGVPWLVGQVSGRA